MDFLPMKSQTESVVDKTAGYMEFDLGSELGYQEWRGMFVELGVKATLFNGYMVQSQQGVQVSLTPVQFHLFEHAMYLAPPFEGKSYYFELPRATAKLGKVYFRVPTALSFASLDGYKPKRDELYALDIWVDAGEGQQTIFTLVYEARIQSDRGEYKIERFESEQIFR